MLQEECKASSTKEVNVCDCDAHFNPSDNLIIPQQDKRNSDRPKTCHSIDVVALGQINVNDYISIHANSSDKTGHAGWFHPFSSSDCNNVPQTSTEQEPSSQLDVHPSSHKINKGK